MPDFYGTLIIQRVPQLVLGVHYFKKFKESSGVGIYLSGEFRDPLVHLSSGSLLAE